MLWAQWAFAVLFSCWFVAEAWTVLSRMARDRDPDARLKAAAAALLLVFMVSIVFIVVAAGAFDRILGWPS